MMMIYQTRKEQENGNHIWLWAFKGLEAKKVRERGRKARNARHHTKIPIGII